MNLWRRIALAFMGALLVILIQDTSAHASTSLSVRDLKNLSDFANDICHTPPMESSNREVVVSGKLKVELPKLLKSLSDAAVEGKVDWRSKKTKGVIQEELAGLIKSSNQCRLEVLEYLKSFVVFGHKANWIPIFSQLEIKHLPLCSAKNVACEHLGRRDYLLYGYDNTIVSLRGSSKEITYPGHVGEVSVGSEGLTFEYLEKNGDDKIGDVNVCLCPKAN